MYFWIHIKFTKILGQFKQKNICWFIHEILFKIFFLHCNFYFIFNTLLNKLQNHLFIYNIWINFAKENVC